MYSMDLDSLDFEKGGGVVTVVVQHARTGLVLMVAHADREALERTIASGEMHFRSRSRGAWHKGETSGNTQKVVTLTADCDRDAVLASVIPAGPACHTGSESCFAAAEAPDRTLAQLDAIIGQRAAAMTAADGGSTPSYTQRLLADRNLRLKKLGEEVAELVAACADENPSQAAEEAADLIYHTLVALRGVGAGLDDVVDALGRRRR